jgi:N-acetylated-alpha-linked acidic dipeptidase
MGREREDPPEVVIARASGRGRAGRRPLRLAVPLALIGVVAWRLVPGPRDSMARRAAFLEDAVSPERIGRQVAELASHPHRAGSAANQAVGAAIAERLSRLGLQVAVTEVLADLPEPREARLSLEAPEAIEFDLLEKRLTEDPDTGVAETEIPFFAFAPDGDVTAPVVFANYGTREDYALLRERGIDVRGAVVLLRAQGICRSMKALIAEEEGAAGLVLYPEPRDLGFRKAAYPDGPHSNAWTVQRGSMLRYFLYPGDPTDPEAVRAATRPGLPALPISTSVAVELFRRMGGAPAPAEWTGWLEAP